MEQQQVWRRAQEVAIGSPPRSGMDRNLHLMELSVAALVAEHEVCPRIAVS